jgi:photosystem II stability/assembly factor-like uncharacterized protein
VLILLFSLSACGNSEAHSGAIYQKIKARFISFPVQGSVRAIKAIGENTLWYAGQRGQFGYTKDGGQSWHRDSIKVDGYQPGFRALEITEEAVFLLSTDSPAILFKSTDEGQSWQVVYREDHPDCYYNSLSFWDTQDGIGVGDAVDGCLSVILTRDGGNTWTKLSCAQLPEYVEGEGGFAASNTNIVTLGDEAWVGTGGATARILHTSDRGQRWEVFETPMNQGGDMTGIFSVAFEDSLNGMLFGGDWQDQNRNTRCKAITRDGGRTWQLFRDGQEPAYRSCVQYVPETNGQEIFAVGMPGISYSPDGGNTWQKVSDEDFYTIRMTENDHSAWLAGKNKIVKMTW